jgi:hypothetical protein
MRWRRAAEVHHHRHVGLLAGGDRAIHRIPFAADVMRRLDADDQARVLADPHRRQLRIHVGEVLLDGPAFHARADDVDEGEDARPRPIDDVLLELKEVPPSRSPRVDERGLPVAERMVIGRHRLIGVAQVRVLLGPEEDVSMHIDQSGNDI